MSDIIKVLPDSVANQIAAGEVIQRPASVIKELVENSVDAGATDIRIVVKDAGKTLIQVIDNGRGMSETDARMAFERHATSKIRKADDLFQLMTMGFRGEALPSICAISEIEVKTRKEDSQIGTRLVILGSKVVAQEPCVCDKGTIISVRKIFFNVPARRKFLKSDNVELSNIMREFERLALVNNHIRMHFDNGTRQIDLRPGPLRLRIEELWRNNLKSDHLIPVDVETSLVKIEGFISRPEFARRRNPLQFLIVNGRNMRHPYFHKAILSCFDNLIASDTQPCYFIKFTVDPSTIDVNIHPTKNEIKFEYEQQIWPILVSSIKTSLGKFSAVPSIDFSVSAIPIDPLNNGEKPIAPKIDYSSDYNPFKSERSPRIESNWEKLYANFNNPSTKPSSNSRNEDTADSNQREKLVDLILGDQDFKEIAPVCLQLGLKYIITTSDDRLLIIDQHRAHVKILYEEYKSRMVKSDIVFQSVMFPESLKLDSDQEEALMGIMDELKSLGFKIRQNKDNDWLILSFPTLLRNSDPRDVILRILDSISVDSVNYGKEGDIKMGLREKMAMAMARSAAIRRGQKLTIVEMESIVSSLMSLPDPNYTPDGNKIFAILEESQIQKLM